MGAESSKTNAQANLNKNSWISPGELKSINERVSQFAGSLKTFSITEVQVCFYTFANSKCILFPMFNYLIVFQTIFKIC